MVVAAQLEAAKAVAPDERATDAVVPEAVVPGATAPDARVPAAGAALPTGKPRLLMLTHRLPYPPDRGDRIRTYHMLRVLSRSFEVSLASTSEDPVWLQHHQLVRSVAKQAFIQPISSRYGRLKGLLSLLSGRAVTPAAYFRQGIADQVLQWHERAPFDAVLTVCTSMVRYAELLERLPLHVKAPPGTLRPLHVMDLMDVDSEKWAAYAADSRWPMSWVYRAESARLRRIEAGRNHHFDAITLVSEAEAQAYRRLVSSTQPVHAVNNGVDMDYFHAMPDAPTANIVFVGVLNYKPNSDGVAWFAERVMPGLRERAPQVKFQIIGRHPTARVMELNAIPGVQVVGSVPDTRHYLRDACAVVAPLQIARGVQNKVLEGMSCARAVVCSPEAHEGIDAVDGEHLLVARDTAQWVDTLARIINDGDARRRVATAARDRIVARYSWESCLQPLVDLLMRCRLPGRPPVR